MRFQPPAISCSMGPMSKRRSSSPLTSMLVVILAKLVIAKQFGA